jgi:hypothetical protein
MNLNKFVLQLNVLIWLANALSKINKFLFFTFILNSKFEYFLKKKTNKIFLFELKFLFIYFVYNTYLFEFYFDLFIKSEINIYKIK